MENKYCTLIGYLDDSDSFIIRKISGLLPSYDEGLSDYTEIIIHCKERLFYFKKSLSNVLVGVKLDNIEPMKDIVEKTKSEGLGKEQCENITRNLPSDVLLDENKIKATSFREALDSIIG